MKTANANNREPMRGVIFDKDGTLLDFIPTWLPAYRAGAVFAANGDEEKALKMLVSTGFDKDGETFLPGSLLASGTTDAIAADWSAFGMVASISDMIPLLDKLFATVTATSSVPLPGLDSLLSGLGAKGMSLGVATNDSETSARTFVQTAGIENHFSFVVGYDSGHGSKPGPGMVDAFCDAHDLAPGAVAVIGDNHCDLEMARNARAGYVIGVLSGNGTRAELEPLADAVIDDVSCFPDLDFFRHSGA